MSETPSWLKYVDQTLKSDRPLMGKKCPYYEDTCVEEACALYCKCLNNLIEIVMNLNAMALISPVPLLPKISTKGVN
jgi:hypothetical protein